MLFFFSSRRRHTRLQGDWSSDVCSSDLPCAQRCTSSAEHASPAETSVFSDRHSASGKRESTDGGNVTKIGRASCRGRGRNTVMERELKKENKTTKINSKVTTALDGAANH